MNPILERHVWCNPIWKTARRRRCARHIWSNISSPVSYSCALVNEQNGTNLQIQTRLFSAEALQREERPRSPIYAASLRKVASPFLMKCHPDKIPTLPQTQEPKQVNLKAVQTLNAMLDSIQTVLDSLNRGAESNVAHGTDAVANLSESTLIEFMVPTDDQAQRLEDDYISQVNEHDRKLIPSRHLKSQLLYTRRAVKLSFQATLLNEIKHSLQTIGDAQRKTLLAKKFKESSLQQVVKLIKAAGLVIPYELSGLLLGNDPTANNQQMIQELELDQDDDNQVPEFKIDWELEARKFKRAMENYDREIATIGVLEHEKKLCHDIVAGVVGRVRHVGNVSGLDQLISLRRISLLLQDNFETLQIADHLRLWQSLVIVLENDGSGIVNTESSASTVRKRRFKLKGETGFKFALLDEDVLVITIPLSFEDKEFVNQISRHLHFFDMQATAVLDF